jgi:hypothetical protein
MDSELDSQIESEIVNSSPTKMQRQRQRTLNEQLDLLDKEFPIEDGLHVDVDVQMANKTGQQGTLSSPTIQDAVS